MQLTKGAIGNLINRYKAVLKKCHLMNTFGSLAVAGMLIMGGAGVAVAENTPTSEVTISLGTAKASAYNGQSTTLSDGSNGKHIFVGGTINNIESLDPPHTHFGTFTDPTSITVTKGTYNWDIYAGSLAVADDSIEGLEKTSATSGSTKLVINDGTFEGAELAGGGSASTTGTGVASVTVQGDTSVTINSYTHRGDGLDYIMAGNKVLAGGGAATGKITGNTNLIIDSAGEKNVTTTAVVLGGSGVRVFNSAGTKASDTINGNTNVTTNGDTLAGVVGGSLAEVLSGTGSATATVEGNSTVTISDGTIGQIKFGSNTASAAVAVDPSVVGGSMAYGHGAEALNKGNTLVTIAQAEGKKLIIDDKVLGGSLAQGEGAKVTVGTEGQNNTSGIVVKNVSKVGDLVGGNMAQGGTATLYGDSYVEVEAGKVEGDVMGGSYARGAGTVTTNGNTSVVFNANNNATMPQAEYIVGGDKVLGNGTATGIITDTSSVTVNNGASVTTGAVVGGSFSRATPSATETAATATATVANSKVTINGGTSIAGVVGGGLAEDLSGEKAASTVTGTSTVYVNGGTVTNIVYTTSPSTNASSSAAVAGAGFATGKNATASVKDSVVVIDGADTVIQGNKDKDSAKVVAGGVAVNGGTVKVTSTSLTMKNGKVTGDLVGGNLLEKDGKEGSGIASTTVNVESGTVAGEIYGGSYVRNTNATSEVANTTVNISGGTIGATKPQAWAQYVVGGGKAMSDNTATQSNVTDTATVKISGGNITRGAVVGGGFARAQGGSGSATAEVKDSVVNLTGGSLVGVVGGGLAENLGTETATAGVTTANLTIDGSATVNGIIYKGNDGKETPSSAAVIGGGLAYSQNGSAAAASVDTAKTIINSGTINGDVFAGGMADGSSATANADGTSATANVGTANLTINGGIINGDVYAGGYALDNGTANVTTANVTLKGGSINGKVTVGNATKATITLDGTGAKVTGDDTGDDTGDFEGNESSTLAFNNYNGTFEDVAIGFGTLAVAENSNVYVDALVSGQRGSDRPNTGIFGAPTPTDEGTSNPTGSGFTITGGGTITAKEFHVNPDASVTIEHGNVVADDVKVQGAMLNVGKGSASAGFTANNKLLFEQIEGKTQPSIVINNLGTATLSQTVVFNGKDKIDTTLFNNDQIQVNTGGTLKLEGLDGKTLTEDELDVLQATTKGGLLDLGGADLGVPPDPDGTVNYDKVQGITSDSLKDTTVAVSAGKNTAGVSGGFQAVKLKGDDDAELNAKGTLVLAGSQNGDNLVIDKNGDVADLRVGGTYATRDTSAVTLGLADANNSGTVGTVTLNAGTGNKATLNVIGAGAAEFNVGDIRANESTNTINVAGATLNTGNITTESGTQALDKLNITSGIVNASGDVKITAVVLANGVLAAHEVPATAGGDITLSTLSGQGSVVADKTLTVTNAYTGVDTDALALQANELTTTANFDSTKGDVTIKASQWNASGTTTLKGDAVELTKTGTFTGAFTMDGGALVAQNENAATPATLTFNDDATFTNGAVAVVDSIKMDGTDTNLIVGEAGSDGVSLVVKEMTTAGTGTLTFDPDWGYASNNAAIEKLNYDAATDSNVVNNHLQVGRNSYVALGTTDKGWLPSVVQGGLRKDGVETVLGLAKSLVVQSTGSIELNSDAGYVAGSGWTPVPNTAKFGANSLLVVNGANIYGDKAAISFEALGTLKVAEGAKLLVTDAVAGQTYTIVGNVATGSTVDGWKNNGMTSTTDMISLGDAVFTPGTGATTGKVTTSATRNDAHTVFPNLSDGMANAVNDLYTGHAGAAAGQPNWDYADVNSADMGVRFLSRATDNRFLGMDKEAAAATIESAARIAFAGAVPQMTKMASDAGTNAVVNRLGFADPADGAQAMDADGKIVDRNTTGFALWIAPLWQSQHGWGMDADSMDYGFNGNLGGVSLGADYTFENAIRAGITFNIGGGYAESSGGDLSSTDNRMNFWGLGAYAGWNYENFGVMADVSYTSTWNDLKQDVDSRMGMGDLEADVQATAISAGLRAEYLLQTSAMDIIPHIGVRYMSLNTWGYDVDTHGGTVLEGDSLHQDIWTFPIGVTFSKDFALDSGWNFKPSLDFTVIPAAGDIKAKHDVHFTGLPGTYEVETQMMDYLTWQGGVGLELANDNMSIGVNYTLQAGQHTTGHGVFGSFRYEF